MAGKRNKRPVDAPEQAGSYYDLPLKAVDDLVTADESNSPQVSEKELRKYRSRSRIQLSEWLKALLIKAWFSGAVCFFFYWGLGIYLPDRLDQLVVLGVALGIVFDILLNNLYRFYASPVGANDRWMMWPQKKYYTFPLNILHAFLLLALVVTTYQVINLGLVALTGAKDTIPLGVGPILFGVFTALWDQALISLKGLFLRIVHDAETKSR